MNDMLLALALPPLILVPAMGLLSRHESSSAISAELRRKALHIGLGLACLCFPHFIAEPWMVVAGLALITGWMLAVRSVCLLRRKFGRVLHAAARNTYGELWFALAIAFLLLMSNGLSYLYVVPLLILTLADAVAAVSGRLWPVRRLHGLASGKSLGGSAAFTLCAFVVTCTALQFLTTLPTAAVIAISVTIAVSTAVTEALSHRGTDNFSVPLVAWLLLQLLVPAPTGV